MQEFCLIHLFTPICCNRLQVTQFYMGVPIWGYGLPGFVLLHGVLANQSSFAVLVCCGSELWPTYNYKVCTASFHGANQT